MNLISTKTLVLPFMALSLVFSVEVRVVNAQELLSVTPIPINGISGSGIESGTETSIKEITSAAAYTGNTAGITNNITVNTNTGKNSADRNEGSVSIETGDSSIEVKINNIANASLIISPCCSSITPTPLREPSVTPIMDPPSNSQNAAPTSTPEIKALAAIVHAALLGEDPKVLGLSATSGVIDKVVNNGPLVLGINLITVGLIFIFEAYSSFKKSKQNLA